ncbi:unnamed protein product [Leptosia nina]|uniref:Angio-associated migratory cell protein n=1 Tax=Leptosia nina TaxID=320188 RepID=A0AAV1JNM4_9NEOP
MKNRQHDTPPSSINGDDIVGMDGENDEEFIYMGDIDDQIQFDDDEMVDDQEEEYSDSAMERPEDQAALVFNKHTGSVFCCDLHLNGKVAVTGGEDDKAFVWSVETGDVIMDCKGHKDSVIFVGFSFDGAYLATVDMCGLIKVWKCNFETQEPWQVAFEYEADDLSWGLWHFGARVLLCGADTGDIYVFKIPSGDTKVLQGHSIRTECGKIFPDGVRLAVGYEDGAVKIWDLKTNAILHQFSNGVHETRVTAIDIHPENNLMASISTDGKVVLTTSVNGKVVAQLQAENDLETVAFCPDLQLGYFALGTLNGSVTIWDTARKMIRHSCAKSEEDVSAGVTKMYWNKDQLVTGCLDGSLRVYAGRSGECSETLTGHWSEILDLVYNAKENIILSSSDDGTARIFKYPTQNGND